MAEPVFSQPPSGPPGKAARNPIVAAFTTPKWSPYLVGVLIGVLSWVTFLTMDKALGTSTTMAKAAGALTGLVAADHVGANPYYGKYFNADKGKVMFDWQFFLVIGMIGGAYLAARPARDVKVEHVPRLWAWRFGQSRWKRYAVAFLGGAVMLFGARMAGGCTSGHGISGGLQLALGSWAFFFAMFASGVVTAFALFGLGGRNHV